MARFFKTILFTAMTVLFLLPVVYTAANAFMDANELSYYYGSLWGYGQKQYMAFHLFPDRWSLQSLYEVLLATPEYLLKFWNSLGMTVLIVAGQTVVSVLAGYGFSRFRFPGRGPLFAAVVMIMMMPYQVTLVSNYIILDRMHLVGSYAAVVLPGIFSSFGVFLMKQAIDEIPDEILEAAKLDGAGQWNTLLRIVLPVSRSGMISLVLLAFIDHWNMVEQPQVFLRDTQMYPLSIFLAQSLSHTGTAGFACGVLAMLPVMLLYMNFKEALVKGIALSRIK
ncbi:MAG: carbohydrate ABC transporter permease [Eubacterium sp.]|nr:carbohydrate ABC transporter permease [Eubacterium sp.]